MPPGKNKDEHVRLEEGSEEDGINLNWRFVLASLLHLLVIFGFGISVAAFVCWVQSDFQQTPDYSVFGLLLPFLGIAIYRRWCIYGVFMLIVGFILAGCASSRFSADF